MSDLRQGGADTGDGTLAVPESVRRAFRDRPPGRLMGRGHPIGDYLEAYTWELLEEREGFLRLRVHLPPQVRNPRGQLFGGFTPTYADLVALATVHAGRPLRPGAGWLATLQMRVDYFEPIEEGFEIESAVIRRRGANCWVETRFLDGEGTLLALAITTLRETGRG
jgi:acyl-coenzyme A thioesterase PaaI-like protein